MSSESDAIRESLQEDSLSGLEIVVESDCSEYNETENQTNQSDPFYYVLEEPNPTWRYKSAFYFSVAING